MKPADNKVVIFIDMLGFAALTEHHDVDVDQIAFLSRPSIREVETWNKARRES